MVLGTPAVEVGALLSPKFQLKMVVLFVPVELVEKVTLPLAELMAMIEGFRPQVTLLTLRGINPVESLQLTELEAIRRTL